jgi:hypothetical protein
MYKNLHLIFNDKFFDPAYQAFEKYYPGDNLFLCLTSIKDDKIYSQHNNILYSSLGTFKGLELAIKTFERYLFRNIFIHNADNLKIDYVLHLKRHYSFKIYWIFFGADLHGVLEDMGRLDALDNNKLINKETGFLTKAKGGYQVVLRMLIYKKMYNYSFSEFCRAVDYFCFWNEFDYKLLNDNFNTQATFKNFFYLGLLPQPTLFDYAIAKNKILVNHNASPYGNHQTILSRLKSLNVTDEIICPISYGDIKNAKKIKKIGSTLFKENIIFIENFLSKDEYFELVSSAKVAIFGHRRQEAGANIFAMILNGSKVFLRNDNSVLSWLKLRGFICFSFEDDLNSIKDLSPLDQESISKNKALYSNYFSSSCELSMFEELISDSN